MYREFYADRSMYPGHNGRTQTTEFNISATSTVSVE